MLLLAPLLALLLAARARAEPFIRHPVRLEYELGPGAEGCPKEAAVRHAILLRAIDTKEDPFSPTAKAKLRVVIVQVGPRFKASYELRDDAGERRRRCCRLRRSRRSRSSRSEAKRRATGQGPGRPTG
jgi:hypothetical protein